MASFSTSDSPGSVSTPDTTRMMPGGPPHDIVAGSGTQLRGDIHDVAVLHEAPRDGVQELVTWCRVTTLGAWAADGGASYSLV